jgi:ABC-type bacteriocin/lantibiotic exporter with double-glycine peptidase domain
MKYDNTFLTYNENQKVYGYKIILVKSIWYIFMIAIIGLTITLIFYYFNNDTICNDKKTMPILLSINLILIGLLTIMSKRYWHPYKISWLNIKNKPTNKIIPVN